MSRAPSTIADVLQGSTIPKAFQCGRCRKPLIRPGLCRGCRDIEGRERAQAEREERVRARVPPAYQWATLDPGSDLERALPSVAPLQTVRRWLADRDAPPFLVIRGVTHSRKSSMAGACVRRETESGREAYFVFAATLAPLPDKADKTLADARQLAIDRMRNYRALVVVNDLAKVLGGATGDSGIAAYRRGDLCTELHLRCEARARTIITTTLENRATKDRPAPGIVELFGEDIMARLTDEREAVMVRLERRRE